MARYTCPSCGARYNGKRCRACFYENFSEEISHAPSPKPIFPKREKKQRPFAGLLTIFLLIYSFLPLVRDWGLELETRETAAQMEMGIAEELVELFHQKPVTIYIPQGEFSHRSDGIQLWLRNDSSRDLSLEVKQASANGFVMENAALLLKASANSFGMGTLYLNETPPEAADGSLTVTVTLRVLDDLDMVLLDTHPISLIFDP